MRDFIRDVYLKANGNKVRYFLFRAGSLWLQDREVGNTKFSPQFTPPETRSHQFETYGSDDFYGFMDAGPGEWAKRVHSNHTLDLLVLGSSGAYTRGAGAFFVDKLLSMKRIQMPAANGDQTLLLLPMMAMAICTSAMPTNWQRT